MLPITGFPPGAWPASFADGRYVVLDTLGRGGFASVLRVRDQVLGTERALKLLHPDPPPSESVRQRLFREARAMARMEHPHILRVYDVGSEAGYDYVITEIAAGSLAVRARELGRLPEHVTARLGIQVLAGLDAAHQTGVIHRDVKPQNILLDRRGNALLSDFGIALLLDESHRATGTDAVVGSLAYMAPEQRQDARTVGVEADLYALGAALFAVLTGGNPIDLFLADDGSARWAGLSPEMKAILYKATRMDAAERYRSAHEMAQALAVCCTDSGPILSLFSTSSSPRSVLATEGPGERSTAGGPTAGGERSTVTQADVLGWERVAARSEARTADGAPDSVGGFSGASLARTVDERSQPSAPIEAPPPPAPPPARSRVSFLVAGALALVIVAGAAMYGRAPGPEGQPGSPLADLLAASAPERCPQSAPSGLGSPVGAWVGELRGHPACLYVVGGSGTDASATLVVFVAESDGLIGRIRVKLHGSMNRGRAIMLSEDLGGDGAALTTRPEDQEVLQLILSQEGRLLQGSSYRGERVSLVRFTRAVPVSEETD